MREGWGRAEGRGEGIGVSFNRFHFRVSIHLSKENLLLKLGYKKRG